MRIQKDMVVSTVLAVAIVGGGLWLLDRSSLISMPILQKVGEQPQNVTDHKISSPRTNRQPATTASDTATMPPLVEHGIKKCTVNGKTTYSNGGCPEGAQTENVVLHDSAGIISPPKSDLLMLMAQRKAAEGQDAGRQSVATMGAPQSATEGCALLEQHVQYLNSKARQPQSAATQDWIRQERTRARDRQVALHC